MLHRTISIRYWSTTLSNLALMITLTTLTPTLSHAIPAAGDYVFTGGEILGTFTSDGTQVTKHSIFMPDDRYAGNYGFVSHDVENAVGFSIIVKNDQTSLYLLDETRREFSMLLSWDTLLATYSRLGEGPQGPDPHIDPLIVTDSLTRAIHYLPANNVPEPSGMILLGLGLLALIGYRRQQRRQAGLQLGPTAR